MGGDLSGGFDFGGGGTSPFADQSISDRLALGNPPGGGDLGTPAVSPAGGIPSTPSGGEGIGPAAAAPSGFGFDNTGILSAANTFTQDTFTGGPTGLNQTQVLGAPSTINLGAPEISGGSPFLASFGSEVGAAGGSGSPSGPFQSATPGGGVGSASPAGAFSTPFAPLSTGNVSAPAGGAAAFAPPQGISGVDVSGIDPSSAAAAQPFNTYGYQGLQGAGNNFTTPFQSTGPTTGVPGAGATGQTGAPTTGIDYSRLQTTPQTLGPAQIGGQPQQQTGAPGAGTGTGSQIGQGNTKGGLGTLGQLGGAAGVVASGAGLIQSFLNRNNVPGQQQVDAMKSALANFESQTASLNPAGLQMMSYLQNGQLPPQMKAAIDQATSAAKAQAASDMAARGLPTDPLNNQQLAQQYATIDQQALVTSGQLQQQLYNSGLQSVQTAVQASGLDLQTYMNLQQIYQNQSNQEQQAIGNFAAALGRLGGGGGGTTIKIGG